MRDPCSRTTEDFKVETEDPGTNCGVWLSAGYPPTPPNPHTVHKARGHMSLALE